MKPAKMTKVVDGVKYDTEKATIIAHDCYWDGHNMERNGRNTYLYKTPKGRYFATYLSLWQGELDRLEPLTMDEAIALMSGCRKKKSSLKKRFQQLTLKRHKKWPPVAAGKELETWSLHTVQLT